MLATKNKNEIKFKKKKLTYSHLSFSAGVKKTKDLVSSNTRINTGNNSQH